eukprot:CAMPEP_0170073524 /NCGR_PEP_ID=MMETSP0019_2-20121128/10924_1 /TAXON_ID=98059 /ORGANISM="Dinobryon sp., Strain UTEXLB2267" /LENGTH=116 /DNA_ID=CAMNT_0010283105 /DNA_START=287 /DNA_END=637 /DNA_ORIENTATION=-
MPSSPYAGHWQAVAIPSTGLFPSTDPRESHCGSITKAVQVYECPIRQAAVVNAEIPNPSASQETQGQGGLRGGVGEDPPVPCFPAMPIAMSRLHRSRDKNKIAASPTEATALLEGI